MKTAIAKLGKSMGRIVNARFAARCSYHLIGADFCNIATGWEKGRVEKNVQDNGRGQWQEALTESSASFAELNAWLAECCPKAWAAESYPEPSRHEHE